MKPSTLLKLFSSVFLLFSVVADALEIPQPKRGLWEIHMQNSYDGAAPKVSTSQLCWDAAWEKRMKMAEESSKKDCSKSEVRKEGTKWISIAVCKIDGVTVSSQSTLEFNGENAYRKVTDSTFDPPMEGLARNHMVTDNKWLGPCK